MKELLFVRDAAALGLDLLSIGGKERLLAFNHSDEGQTAPHLGVRVRALSRHRLVPLFDGRG